jgi:uncharacterized membrane protein
MVDMHSLPGITALAAVAAWVMTGWDMVMDPGMAAAGNWVWEHGGGYFGVPRGNYLGWFAGWLWREANQRTAANRTFVALPVIVYSFFAVRYLTPSHFPALGVIALFSMGMPALVALIQTCLNNKVSEAEKSVG